MRPWRLKAGVLSLATIPVLSPESMIDTIFVIVSQLEVVMINVPSVSDSTDLASSMTFEGLYATRTLLS